MQYMCPVCITVRLFALTCMLSNAMVIFAGLTFLGCAAAALAVVPWTKAVRRLNVLVEFSIYWKSRLFLVLIGAFWVVSPCPADTEFSTQHSTSAVSICAVLLHIPSSVRHVQKSATAKIVRQPGSLKLCRLLQSFYW